MTVHAFLLAYAAVLGLLVGSYLNVLIYRVPRGISTVLPRSRCPSCGAPIRPWHNIPLLGYAVLGGRCRACRAPIHWRYPLVEALTASAFVVSFERFGVSLEAVVGAAFCAVMIVLAAIDVEHYLLPDRLTLPGIAAGLLLQPWLTWSTLRGALGGVVLGAGLLLAIAGGWYLLRGVPGMGLGDAKLLAMVGAFLGWRGVVVTLFLASLGASAVALSGWATGRLGPRSRLPFGAFLAAAAMVALWFGESLLSAYLGEATAFAP